MGWLGAKPSLTQQNILIAVQYHNGLVGCLTQPNPGCGQSQSTELYQPMDRLGI
jgi:hypothetical protein